MRKRHTEEQIIVTLKEADTGLNAEGLCRKHGICAGTFYKWKVKYRFLFGVVLLILLFEIYLKY